LNWLYALKTAHRFSNKDLKEHIMIMENFSKLSRKRQKGLLALLSSKNVVTAANKSGGKQNDHVPLAARTFLS
jgi:hypothetical protein